MQMQLASGFPHTVGMMTEQWHSALLYTRTIRTIITGLQSGTVVSQHRAHPSHDSIPDAHSAPRKDICNELWSIIASICTPTGFLCTATRNENAPTATGPAARWRSPGGRLSSDRSASTCLTYLPQKEPQNRIPLNIIPQNATGVSEWRWN